MIGGCRTGCGERIEPMLPERPWHPLDCHNPRADCNAMEAILLVIRTGVL